MVQGSREMTPGYCKHDGNDGQEGRDTYQTSVRSKMSFCFRKAEKKTNIKKKKRYERTSKGEEE